MDLAPPDPRIGQVLQGRYKILSRVAAGAMGVVYRGERIELGRAVAVKFLHPWVASQQAFRSRFETEARAMSRLSHPNCVSVIDFGFEAAPYLVMDYVTGITLRELLESGRLAPARALSLARQLLGAMSHAHSQGIIHRDLKPENLLLSDTAGVGEHLRVLDFGLAKLRDGPAMTAGLAVGTPSYMSPEQAGGEGEIDGRTDIYAVGVLLFEMLVGRKPFVGERVADVLVMHRDMPPPSPKKLVPEAGISRELDEAVLRAMAKHQQDRFQSAEEFAAALAAAPEASLPISAPVRDAPRAHKEEKSRPIRNPAARAEGAARGAGAARGEGAAPAARAAAEPDATIVDPVSRGLRGDTDATQIAPGSSKMAAGAGGAAGERRRAGASLVAVLGVLALALVLTTIMVLRRKSPSLPSSPSHSAATGAQPHESAKSTGAAPSSGHPGAAPAAGVSRGETAEAMAARTESRLADAERLNGVGEWEQALVVLEKAQREDPENAVPAYRYANLSFEHKRWNDGISGARIAAQRDPSLRGDEQLVKNLIRSLANDRVYERAADTLRGFGSAATPFLREAAAKDKSPTVRARAREILDSRSVTGPRRGGPTSSSRSSSAIFKR